MLKAFIFLIYIVSANICLAQEHCLLETEYRNPIDTAKLNNSGIPSVMLFVHPKCQHDHSCYTTRMMESFSGDSLHIREKYKIKLYVVYPKYDFRNMSDYKSYSPKNSQILFLVDKPESLYGYNGGTPYIILFDGRGKIWTYSGVSYEDVVNYINTHVFTCRICKGRGYYVSDWPDYWKDPRHGKVCTHCNGIGNVLQNKNILE